MLELTHENYFSQQAMTEYMSCSQFKQFDGCQSRAMAELNGEFKVEKDAFLEGHLFEALIEGGEQLELFMMQHPEMISSRGESKGNLKANFARIQDCAEAFKRQPLFTDIYNRCEKQVILICEIAGIPFKACLDLYDPVAKVGYDTKCMEDFKKAYSEVEQMYLPWYLAYGYNFQDAIYSEAIRQNYGECKGFGFLAVSKEPVPDVCALRLPDGMRVGALEIVQEYAPLYNRVKLGEAEAISCGHCDWCKQTKILTGFETAKEWGE